MSATSRVMSAVRQRRNSALRLPPALTSAGQFLHFFFVSASKRARVAGA